MNSGRKYSEQTREKVRNLRKRGMSYNEIAKKTGFAKSTISLWCRDVPLKAKDKSRFYTKQIKALTEGPRSSKIRREKEIEIIQKHAKGEIDGLSEASYKIVGAIMYWAEGSKSNDMSVTNSDPRIVKFMVQWLGDVCGVPSARLKAHLHIHYADDESQIKRYWSGLTGIPLKNFGKTFIKPSGTGHRKNILPNGIIRIRVTGKGTIDLRHRVMSWAEKVYELAIDRP